MDDVVLLLANSAESGRHGGVNALGLGWSVTSLPTPPSALVLLVEVPWDQANDQHTLALSLVDADGQHVLVSHDGNGDTGPLRILGEFQTGRPEAVTPGTPIDMAQAIPIAPGLPLAPAASYQWRLEIDDIQVATRSFYVLPA